MPTAPSRPLLASETQCELGVRAELLVEPRPDVVLDLRVAWGRRPGKVLDAFAYPRPVGQWPDKLTAAGWGLLEDKDPDPSVRKVDASSRCRRPHAAFLHPGMP